MSVVKFRERPHQPEPDQDDAVIANPLVVRRGGGHLVPLSEETRDLARARRVWLFKVRAVIATLVLAIFAACCGYGIATVRANKIGDDLSFPQGLRQIWSSPWAGVSAMIIDRELQDHGWSLGAPEWSPSARLTAMPAYQSALIEAIGDHTSLAAKQSDTGEGADPDLVAAARLLEGAVNPAEMRAAREALASFDGRVRLHRTDDIVLPSEFADRLDLMSGWAAESGRELLDIFNTAKGAPVSDDAVMAIYRARARAYLAHRLIWSMNEPYGDETSEARAFALASWARAATFEPYIVLSGGRESLIFPSHPAAMRALMMEAESATDNYARLVRPDPSRRASVD